MSISYDLYGKAFDFDALKKEGPKVGLNPIKHKGNDENQQIYQYGDAYIWAFRTGDDSTSFERYGMNSLAVQGLDELADAIGTELVCEHDDLDEVAERWGRKEAKEIDGSIESAVEELGEDDEFEPEGIWYDEILTKIP